MADHTTQTARAGFDPRRPHHWLAFGFGSGLVPRAPGTAGTLVAVPLYLLLAPLPAGLYLTLVGLAFVIGVWACGRAGRDLGEEDSPSIVWDEIVGFLLAMTAIPMGLPWLVLGVVLFRLLDILKPGPIRWLDRNVRGGLGVMLDDVAAGATVWLILKGMAMIVAASAGAPAVGH